MYIISIEESFSAAHQLRDYHGKCSGLHGHNWRVIVRVQTDRLDDIGMAIDFCELQTVTRNIVELVDHKNLNELEYFSYQNPTSENLARFFYLKIQEQLPPYAKMSSVEMVECEGCSIIYSESQYEGK